MQAPTPTSVASLPSYEHEQLQLVLPSLMSSYAAITNGLSHMRSLSSNKSMSGNGLSVRTQSELSANNLLITDDMETTRDRLVITH